MFLEAPMLSVPFKTTTEIDWVAPLKNYIRATYGDPERYTEECQTLNRLRQDMRGAGKDSAAGRDLLYRYYGQLELLDLRFPIDEHHIKISFTWYDAFTHKPTSQYSLAYEKASIIFNISAVLSCHAARQARSEDLGLKTAYHSFQASAGMFTYINDNFLHAPSTDLSRDTVKTLITIMLAQAQEVFLEKQIRDEKKVGLLAKLAAQAGMLYAEAVVGVQDNVQRAIFEKVWLLYTQIKQSHFISLSHYYQALAENDASSYGSSIARLQIAEQLAKDAVKFSNQFPHNPVHHSNFTADTGPGLQEITKRHLSLVQDRLHEFIRDNDYIYHQPIPSEASLTVIPKLPAAKPISVQELYAGQDIHKIIGPDIFSKIVPMSVTESASLYDEEKAKLVRAETEKAELANAEMATSLDYLNLPNSLKVLKGGFQNDDIEIDEQYRGWMDDMGSRGESLDRVFESLKAQKKRICEILDQSTKTLDQEESVCEKMRAKYVEDWTQQPSARLTVTMRSDIRNYRDAIEAAVNSDNQLFGQYRMVREDIEEMRVAAVNGQEEELFRRAVERVRQQSGVGKNDGHGESLLDIDDSEDGVPVLDQIARVEDLLRKLNSIKRERGQVLKDLKEKVHNDDISNVLILNKKTTLDPTLFESELEKFREHQRRLMQAMHKQSALMKELTLAYGDLLQDPRIRAQQSRYDTLARQRTQVLSRFRKSHQAYLEILDGLSKATNFYNEMKETVDSLQKNVDTFVNNRRNEGAQLLSQIETGKGTEAEREQKRMKEMMEKLSMGPPAGARKQQQQQRQPGSLDTRPQVPQKPTPPMGQNVPTTPHSPPTSPRYDQRFGSLTSPTPPPPPNTSTYPPYSTYPPQANGGYQMQQGPRRDSYGQPMPPIPAPRRDSHSTLPPPTPTHPQYQPSAHFSSPPGMYASPGYPQQYNPGVYGVPPPPPGPPPQQALPGQPLSGRQSFPNLPGGYQVPPPPPVPGQQQGYTGQQQQGGADPWGGLAGWK